MSSPIDKIEFMGEKIAELTWSLRYLAFSGSAVAYHTDQNNLVVVVDEWEDEWEDENPRLKDHSTKYVIVSLDEINRVKPRTRMCKFIFGDHKFGDKYVFINNSMKPAFGSRSERRHEMTLLLIDELGL